MSLSALAIRHVPFEELGVLAPVLAERGYSVRYLEAGVDAIDAATLGNADLVVILGGPIGVYETGRYPFLEQELRAIAHRCPCGNPDVVETAPRLPDGTPFPTTYYLTCPRAASAIGTLEANGVMKEMQARLATDPELAAAYRAAHEDYIARRDAIEVLEGFPSAGGMPDRVKCLHVLVGHSLVAGPGVNPFGDEAIAMLPEWWAKGPCVTPGTEKEEGAAE